MPLTVVRTGLTMESSSEYLDEIKELHLSGTGKKLILVVPDSFSYIAEKRICETVGGCGLNGVEVLTLHQLVRNLSENVSLISSVGKQILVKKAIDNCIGDDSIFASSGSKPGFVEKMLDTLSRWKRHGVDKFLMYDETDKLDDIKLKSKMTDITSVYSEYCRLLEESECSDSTDELYLAAEEIRKNDSYDSAYIWIDEFSEFAPPEIEIIKAFLEKGANIKIYLPIEEYQEDDSVCDIVYGTYYDLLKMASECGFEFRTEDSVTKKKMADELMFLCENYDRDSVYEDKADGIRLHIADDIYSEAENAACEIIDLVTDKGYKYSDISLLCGNLSDYASCLEAVFEKYGIPYFSDYKLPLSGHPVSILITSVFEIINNMSFPLKSVIRYLKTGYPIDNSDDTDMITGYAKSHGIKGNMWLNPKYFLTENNGFFAEFLGSEAREVKDSGHLEELREKITRPLCSYAENSKGIRTIKEHIAAFFGFMTEIELFENIEKRVRTCDEKGDENEAARLTHVWNILIDIFNQMSYATGDEKVTREVFAEYLITGIEGSEISIIPTVTNGISVSDTGKRTDSDVRALFILGATNDTVPKVRKEEGIITDDETEFFRILPKNDTKARYNKRMELEFVRGISSISEYLYISTSRMAVDGSKLEKSPVFDSLLRMFPKIRITYEKDFAEKRYVTVPEAMLHRLLVKMAGGEKITAIDKCAVEWFAKSEKYKDAFGLIEEAEKYKILKGSIPKELSAKLYGEMTKYSVSRLQQYFKCPFSYFLSYGLSVKEIAEYGMQATDTGSLVHEAVVMFCKAVEDGAESFDEKKKKWFETDDNKSREIIDGIMENLVSGAETDSFLDNIFRRVRNTLIRTAKMIVISMQKSKYGILNCELDFTGFTLKSTAGTAQLRGIIDRIDSFTENGTEYARIIDYKTGMADYNEEDVLNGIDLQLILYAMAAEEKLGGDVSVSGMFYNSVKKRIASGKDTASAADVMKKYKKLSGCVFAPQDENGVLGIKTGTDMDSDLETVGESSYLPLKLTKKETYHASASKVRSDLFYSKLKGYVNDLVVEGVQNIENGDVRVYPYVKKGSCDYCKYSSICMYDMENGSEVNDGRRGREALDYLKKEDE